MRGVQVSGFGFVTYGAEAVQVVRIVGLVAGMKPIPPSAKLLALREAGEPDSVEYDSPVQCGSAILYR